MSFCAAVSCMDGRIQLPVNAFLRERFSASYVDTVTEAGPVLYLAVRRESVETEAILRRVRISVEKHGSRGIAVVGHYDCAGHPVDEMEQRRHIRLAAEFVAEEFPGVEVIGLWVDEEWKVRQDWIVR